MPRTKPSDKQIEAAKAKKQAALDAYKGSKEFLEANQDSIQERLEAVQQMLVETAGVQFKEISLRNFAFVLMQMQAQGLDGMPYVHTRTFDHWKEIGRQVRKGEKSTICSITWIPARERDEEGKERLYPKLTHLFHVSQTDAIEGAATIPAIKQAIAS